jgi:hypothetical protein
MRRHASVPGHDPYATLLTQQPGVDTILQVGARQRLPSPAKPVHCNSRAFADHVVIGPAGVVLVDSKRYTGRVWQGPDGRVWHNHYPMDRPLRSLRMACAAVAELLGVPVRPLVCVHGARVDVAGLASGGEVIPAGRLHAILTSPGPRHSRADVAAVAANARAMLRPA